MAYLVQKTNMFKQKMKIDDKITGRKLHPEPAEDSCTGFRHAGFPLAGSMIHCHWKTFPVCGIIKVPCESSQGGDINALLAFRRA